MQFKVGSYVSAGNNQKPMLEQAIKNQQKTTSSTNRIKVKKLIMI